MVLALAVNKFREARISLARGKELHHHTRLLIPCTPTPFSIRQERGIPLFLLLRSYRFPFEIIRQ